MIFSQLIYTPLCNTQFQFFRKKFFQTIVKVKDTYSQERTINMVTHGSLLSQYLFLI